MSSQIKDVFFDTVICHRLLILNERDELNFGSGSSTTTINPPGTDFTFPDKEEGTILYYNQNLEIDYLEPPNDPTTHFLSINNNKVKWIKLDLNCNMGNPLSNYHSFNNYHDIYNNMFFNNYNNMLQTNYHTMMFNNYNNYNTHYETSTEHDIINKINNDFLNNYHYHGYHSYHAYHHQVNIIENREKLNEDINIEPKNIITERPTSNKQTILFIYNELYTSQMEILENLRKNQGFTVLKINATNLNYEFIKKKIEDIYSFSIINYILIIGNSEDVPTKILTIKSKTGSSDISYGIFKKFKKYDKVFVNTSYKSNLINYETQYTIVNIDLDNNIKIVGKNIHDDYYEFDNLIENNLDFVSIDATDYKIIVGRLTSGDNIPNNHELTNNQKIQNIKNQVQKIIDYELIIDKLCSETNNQIDENNVKNIIGLAGNETYSNESNLKDSQFMRKELIKYHDLLDLNVTEFYDGYSNTLGSDDYIYDEIGDPSSKDVINKINNGISLLLYLGHTNKTTLKTSNLDIGDIEELYNKDKYFLAHIVGCKIGDHTDDYLTLSEKLQISRNKGSIATFVSSVEQSWIEPMYMQRKFNDLIITTDNVKTIGELFKLSVVVPEFLNSDNFWYYQILGDPSTRFILTIPIIRPYISLDNDNDSNNNDLDKIFYRNISNDINENLKLEISQKLELENKSKTIENDTNQTSKFILEYLNIKFIENTFWILVDNIRIPKKPVISNYYEVCDVYEQFWKTNNDYQLGILGILFSNQKIDRQHDEIPVDKLKEYYFQTTDEKQIINDINNSLQYNNMKGHSPIIGIALDGYPIYGPIGFDPLDNNTNIESKKIKLMQSRYKYDNDNDKYVYNPNNDGDLDICNGIFSSTPQFPKGIYHYHTTLNGKKNNNNIWKIDKIEYQFPYLISKLKGKPLETPS